MRTTIRDIARLANVSVATASMAINGKQGVNAETKAKVLEVAQKLNYYPNHFARSLITRKSSTIGLIVSDVTNPFFGLVIENIRKAVEKKGYKLLLGISNDTSINEKMYIEDFISRNVDGLIIIPVVQKNPDIGHIYELKRMGIPFIFITSAYSEINADCVMTDLAKGSYLITKHLLDTGHRKIFLISAFRELVLSNLRTAGYMKAFEDKGLDFKNEWIIETFPDFEHGYDTTSEIIKKYEADAIITVNDVLAMGVLKSLKDKGIKVPEQISVAGYDDLIFSCILETPLTTVKQPIGDICIKAVEKLFSKLSGNNNIEEVLYLEPELKIRASTRNTI